MRLLNGGLLCVAILSASCAVRAGAAPGPGVQATGATAAPSPSIDRGDVHAALPGGIVLGRAASPVTTAQGAGTARVPPGRAATTNGGAVDTAPAPEAGTGSSRALSAAGGGTGTSLDGDTVTVTAGFADDLTITDTPGGAPNGPVVHCGWFDFIAIGINDFDVKPAGEKVVGTTYMFHCWTGDDLWAGAVTGYPRYVVYEGPGDPPGPIVGTETAAQYALDSITFEAPAVELSPASTQVVGVPTWFSLTSRLAYPPASAQAGPVWATVRPEFRDVTWELADGTVFVCTDVARRWDPAGGPDQVSRCRHVFSDDLGGATTVATATVRWTIWQRTDKAPTTWSVWGTVRLSSTFPVTVRQLQSVIG